MKRNILFLLVAALAVAGCWSKNAPVEVVDDVDCINCDTANMVQYSMPNGNDLKLETAHHVIEIEAQPGKQYDYYIWIGERSYTDDPDLIIEEGIASVRVKD